MGVCPMHKDHIALGVCPMHKDHIAMGVCPMLRNPEPFHCKVSDCSLQSRFVPLQSFGFLFFCFTARFGTNFSPPQKNLAVKKKKFAVKKVFHCKLFFFHCKVTLLWWSSFGILWGGVPPPDPQQQVLPAPTPPRIPSSSCSFSLIFNDFQ